MVILRLDRKNRMVTKGYRRGVYEWVEGIDIASLEVECALFYLPINTFIARGRRELRVISVP